MKPSSPWIFVYLNDFLVQSFTSFYFEVFLKVVLGSIFTVYKGAETYPFARFYHTVVHPVTTVAMFHPGTELYLRGFFFFFHAQSVYMFSHIVKCLQKLVLCLFVFYVEFV